MNVITKTYSIIEGQLRFEFYYDPAVTVLTDFEIIDISELRYGYDSADPKEISIYPSNINIVIDDFFGDNYKNFKQLYKAYSPKYPFNFHTTFYLLIRLNGTVLFNGIIDELESNHENKNLTITLVDGINKYKDVQIGTPDMLAELYARGIVPRTQYTIPFAIGSYAYAYGFNRIRYMETSPGISNELETPGYIIDQVGNADKAVSLSGMITQLIKILRPDISVEFSNQFKFGSADASIDEMVFINSVRIIQVLQYLLGRYVVIPKHIGRYNQIGYLRNYPDYTKPEHFKTVYEDYRHIVLSHNYSGQVSEAGSTFNIEKGIEEKTIAEILKVLANNLFSYYGLKSVNTFFFKHKRYSLATTNITEKIMSMNKVLTIDKIDYVKIQDYYLTAEYGQSGSNYGNDERVINYSIPLNAIFTSNSEFIVRMRYINLSGYTRDVHYFYDPVTDYKNYPMNVIANSEWESFKAFRDQYELELTGIDYEFDSTYFVNYENYTGKFRPITLEKNLLESKTKMTALEIG